MRLKTITFFLLLVYCGFGQKISQKDKTDSIMIAGIVIDSLTKEPIEDALVKVVGTRNSSITDISGKFTLKTASNFPLKIRISSTGYISKNQEIKKEKKASNTVKISITINAKKKIANPDSINDSTEIKKRELSNKNQVFNLFNRKIEVPKQTIPIHYNPAPLSISECKDISFDFHCNHIYIFQHKALIKSNKNSYHENFLLNCNSIKPLGT